MSTKKPNTSTTSKQPSWKKEFDKKFGEFVFATGMESINSKMVKAFITQTLANQQSEIVEKLEGKREKLAELEHDQWIEWSSDLMHKENLSEKRIKRWTRLQFTDYSALTEEEKDQDRVYADKVISQAIKIVIG